MVMDSLYKAMLNMRLRRKFVYSNDKVKQHVYIYIHTHARITCTYPYRKCKKVVTK